MAGNSATLAIRIVSDANQAGRGFADTESRVARFQGGLDRASVAAGGLLMGMGAIAKQAYDAASNLQQSAGAIETVYGDQAAAVEELASRSADAMGLSQRAYQENAALIGSQLQTLGVAHEDVIPTMDSLQQRAADLAATFGGSTEDAVAALSSALKGERDPIERYGIALSQASVDAQVAAMGLDTSTDAAKRAAQTQATLALVMDQSAASQGAFANEADTAAGQSARATAAWEDASAQLGEVLLPLVTEGAQRLAELAGWLVTNKDTIVPLIAVVAGLAGGVLAVNGAIRGYQAVARAATAIQWLLNVAMTANPIGLVVLGIAALAAGFVIAYQKVGWFRDGIQTVVGWLKTAWEWVTKLWNKLTDSAVGRAVAGMFSAPATVATPPTHAAGLYGAAAGSGPIRGAAISGAGGGVGPAAGSGSGGNTFVQIDVHGQVVDPVALGRTLDQALRDYAAATGKQLTVTVGGRP